MRSDPVCRRHLPKPEQPAARQSRLQQLIERSLQQLDSTEQRLDAIRRLENLGALAIPQLKQRLQWPKRNQLSRQQQVDLLYVLGSMGKLATPILPEVLSWLDDQNAEILEALLTTLAQLAVHLDDADLTTVGRELDKLRSGLRTATHAQALAQVRLGQAPSTQQLMRAIADYEWDAVAACRKICAAPSSVPEDRQQLTAALRTRLDGINHRKFFSTQRGTSNFAGELAAAWLTISGEAPDASVARGLLNHRLPSQRLRGVLWLDQHGQDLPAEERCDLVVRLWDGDEAVVTAGASALGHWQQNGALALPALLLMAEGHAAATVRAAATGAVQAITKGFATLPDPDRDWLLGAHAVLSDQTPVLPKALPSATGKRALTEMLMMAQWQNTERLCRLLEFTAEAQPDLAMVGSVQTWLTMTDPPLIDAVLSWLSRHASLTIESARELGYDDLAYRWQTLASYAVPRTCCGTALEAAAWFQTAHCVTADFTELLEDGNTRLQARALAEFLLRPSGAHQKLTAPGITAHLRGLADLHHQQQVTVRVSQHHSMLQYPYQLAEPVRMLAVMMLARSGQVAEDRNDLGDLVRKHFACSLDELPKVMRDLEQTGMLADRVETFEQMCRRALFVPEHLKWPRAGKQD